MRTQALVRQGLLKLVMWRDMPIPKKGTPYAHQVSDGGRPYIIRGRPYMAGGRQALIH